MNKTVEVAEIVKGWFEENASVFEFDGRIEFDGLSLEDMKGVDAEKVWEIVSPVLKGLVADYITSQIEELDEE